MTRLTLWLTAFGTLVTIIAACDDYTHNSVVNTPPINFINLTMQNSWGGEGYDWGVSMTVTDDNEYIIAGSTTSKGYGENTAYLAMADSKGILKWYQWYGGFSDDRAEAVALSPDSGIIIAGVTKSFLLETGHKIDPNSGIPMDDYNVYVIKTNLEGVALWEKPYGDSLCVEWGTSISVFADGYMIAGYQAANQFDDDFFFLKTDLDGDLAWQKSYGTADRERALSIDKTSDGGFILGGYREKATSTERDAFLIKINADGDVLWENTQGAEEFNETVYSIMEAANGDILGVGVARPHVAASEEDLVYVIRMSAAGELLWENRYHQSGINEGRCIVEDPEGDLMICGQHFSDNAIHISKLDAEGNFQWSDSSHVNGYGMSMLPEAPGYVISGSTTYPNHSELNDVLILKVVEDLTNLE